MSGMGISRFVDGITRSDKTLGQKLCRLGAGFGAIVLTLVVCVGIVFAIGFLFVAIGSLIGITGFGAFIAVVFGATVLVFLTTSAWDMGELICPIWDEDRT